jgi:hypothetical protein
MAEEEAERREEELHEVEIVIEPRFERLEELGVSMEEFEEAIAQALDEYHDLVESQGDPAETPDVDQIMVKLKGGEVPLGEIAEIRFSGDFD